MVTRKEIADIILDRLLLEKENLIMQFRSKNKIPYFILDELLPVDLAYSIYEKFPNVDKAKKRKNLREHKHVAYQMDHYDAFIKEVLFAFHDDRIVTLIGEICHLEEVLPDKNLYAGGLSMMKKGNFLNPHLDNSHDKDRNLWRVLNVLYYTTPDWKLDYGGNLELWQNGLKKEPEVIQSKFNRIVVMATHQESWHSVNEVLIDKTRCCVSNYYFSETSFLKTDSFHVTTFRARPSDSLKGTILKFDSYLRSGIRKIFKNGIVENPHQYKEKS